MTALLGGSLTLIVVSAAAIVLGWANSAELLIYVSIAATAGVAVCLAIAYNRSRDELERAQARARRRRGSARS